MDQRKLHGRIKRAQDVVECMKLKDREENGILALQASTDVAFSTVVPTLNLWDRFVPCGVASLVPKP